MIRDIPSDVAAYACGCTVEDLVNYRKARLLDWIGERQGKAYVFSVAEVLYWLAPLRNLARCGFGLQRAHAIVRDQYQQHSAAENKTAEQIVVVDVSAPVAERWAAEEGVTDADMPKTRVVVDFDSIAAFARARLEFAQAARHSAAPRRRGSQRPTVSAIHVARS